MSLRWIHENCKPPVCDEESSDIDDSCSDDSYDSDLTFGDDSDNNNCSCLPKAHRKIFSSLDAVDAVANNGNLSPEVTWQSEKKPSGISNIPQVVANNTDGQSSKVKLYCRTGYYIGITITGRVTGFPSDSKHRCFVNFILTSLSPGLVRLQDVDTGYYLAINATGHLYGEQKTDKDNALWEHWSIGKYESFRSYKYKDNDWWLAIKNNGRQKPGPKTAWGQKAIEFIIIRFI